ncbi:MAG: class I adenylate-forming enzyme family protein [Firmicutes bacterium]|nr:class I adenylate-forming enzyme family protein [Bacillota bacterium]MDY5335372.1 class I adenylate-forming enzyme family protein [Bacilli bacterium]
MTIKNIDIYSEMNGSYVVDKDKKITGYASIDKPWQKYYSKEAITASIPELTAYQYMVSQNEDNLSTKAIMYYGKKISYKNYIDMIDETARRLYNLGVTEGEVVTVMSVANPELEVLFYALNKLGAVINLIDVRSDYKQIKKYLMEVKSSEVVVMDNFLPEFDKCMEDEDIDNIVENVITLSPYNSVLFPFNVLAEKKSRKEDSNLYSKIDEIKKKNKYMTWNDLMSVHKYRYPRYPRYKKNMVAALVHTGGTTGVPKTVKLSNENFNAMAIQYKSLNANYNKGDTFLNGIVPFVAYGIVVTIHMPMCLGMTNIIAPILSPKEFTEFMIKYKPNHTITVPTYVEHFVHDRKADSMNWKCLKNLGIGGDYFPEQSEIYVNEFLKNHGSSSIAEKGYGMTENSSTAGVCLVGVNKINSLGIPLPLNTYGIFERGTDKELKYGEEGEICITGPTEMLGYLDNEEEEGKVIKIHSDGKKWIHSEDVGIIDEDGFLFFKGRYKRLIPHGGFKLYPSYIEGVIMKHPNIDNCCVISIPDKVYGASPEAHVVIKKDNVSELKKLKEELIKLCQDKLPSYSQPEDFIFEEDLPLTSVGKVDYKKVEKMRIKKLEESTK